jgi:hypothetical protein
MKKVFRWRIVSFDKSYILIIVLCIRRTIGSLHLSSQYFSNCYSLKRERDCLDIHLQNWTNPCEPNPCRAGSCELVSKLTFSCHCIPVSRLLYLIL